MVLTCLCCGISRQQKKQQTFHLLFLVSSSEDATKYKPRSLYTQIFKHTAGRHTRLIFKHMYHNDHNTQMVRDGQQINRLILKHLYHRDHTVRWTLNKTLMLKHL